MPEFTLTMRQSPNTSQTASAWYLASDKCDDWLREIIDWNTAQAELRLIPLPASASDGSVMGVLIIGDGLGVNASARCIPYVRIAPNVYAPFDAELQPCLDERELSTLLVSEYLYVWHPGLGLIAAEDKDVLRPADLLAPLRRGKRRWNKAVLGIAIGERLTMLTPVVELSFQQIVDESRDDIGTQQNSLMELPESPTEPGNGLLDKAGRGIAMGLAGALYGFSKLFPTGASQTNWINKLAAMAADKFNQVKSAQEHLRHKEIARLLNMLEQDPDQGLKFALPLSAMAHRGLALPSNRLSLRNIGFDLGRLGSGKPADFWQLAAQHRQSLLTKYRELANREMHLGRHRRAAYIFAELLGDLDAAALALANGRHHREAAILYRDRLRRPLDAAKCLENGGLWSEAIEQYEELKLHEQAGTLYTKLGDTEKAGEAYRTAAIKFRAENNFLSAARIWEQRLDDPDEAIEELKLGWPNSPQAVECIRAMFALFGRTGQHAVAQRQIHEVVRRSSETKHYVRTAEVLSELATGKYPDVEVREKAADATQRVVSERLRLAYRDEAQQLVTSLSRLEPNDRLLARDGRRFASDLPIAQPVVWSPRPSLRKVSTIEMSLPGAWRAATVVGDVIVAVGVMNHRLVMRRCNFCGNRGAFVFPWPHLVVRTDPEIVLVADPVRHTTLGMYTLNESPLVPTTAFASSDDIADPITVGAFPGTDQPVGIARGVHGCNYSLKVQDGFILQATNDQGDLLSTHRLPIDDSLDLSDTQIPIIMHARRKHLFIALGRFLLAVKQGTYEQQKIEFPAAICHLVGTMEHTRSRIAVGLKEGACMLWDPAGEYTRVSFASHMVRPFVGINRGGYVIAASGCGLEVYDCKEGKLNFLDDYNELPAAPLAVLIGSRTDQFAIMCQNGDVLVFEI